MVLDPLVFDALNITPASLIIINEQGIIEFFNPTAEKMFLYASKEVVGKNISLLMPEPHRSVHHTFIEDYLRKGVPMVIGRGREDKAMRRDGSMITIHLSVDEIILKNERHFIAALIDITENENLLEQLTLTSERSTLAQRFAQIGFWDWTIASGDLYWSERIAPMFGYELGDLETSYENFLSAIHPEDREKVTSAVNDCVANGARYDIEHRVIWPDGTIRWLLERGDVIRDESGKPLRMLGVVQDITSRKELEQEIIHAKEAAERSARAKSVFLANMSHEIRTPMNAVVGLTEVVLETDLTHEQRDHLRTVRNSAKSLLSLLNDILDISKLESGKLGLEKTIFHLPRLLKETIQTLDLTAREKALELNLTVHEDLFHCVVGDPSRLRQILINLVGNAIKFTPKGEVTLSVEPLKEGLLHFAVRDSGIGMTEKQLSKIFEPFTQADDSTARRFGGTGLGTTISKQLVELMQGTIWAESEIGKGTTFHFTALFDIPACAVDCSKTCPAHAVPGDFSLPQSPRRFKILLVEDIEANVTLATIRLGRQGHEVTVAWNGLEALKYYEKEPFDLILMDVQMPGMDGMEATRKIRELERDSHIPIIAMTASVMAEDLELCRRSGMDDVVGKPVDFAQLFATMENNVAPGVGKPVKRDQLEIGPIQSFIMESIHGVDLKKGMETWLENGQYQASLLEFAKKYGRSHEELTRLLKEEEYEKAYRLTHALKGVAGNLAAEEIYRLAGQIDQNIKTRRVSEALSDIELLGRELVETSTDIRAIGLTDKQTVSKVRECDPLLLRTLLEKTLDGLEGDNPDLVLPLIGELSTQLEESVLSPLREQVEDFEFEAAKEIVQQLLDSVSKE